MLDIKSFFKRLRLKYIEVDNARAATKRQENWTTQLINMSPFLRIHFSPWAHWKILMFDLRGNGWEPEPFCELFDRKIPTPLVQLW
jgi:hypothetical protein